MSTKTAIYQPPQSEKTLVLAWLRRARESQMAHYEMSNSLSKLDKLFGVPVIFITSVVGTSAFSSLALDKIPMWATIIIGLASVSAAVLSSLQTFFKFSERAEKHQASAVRFGAVRRKLEALYAENASPMDKNYMNVLREELDRLAQEALHVPVKVFNKIQKNIHFTGDDKISSPQQ